MGYEVTRLTGADLTPEKLARPRRRGDRRPRLQRPRPTSPRTCRRCSPTSRPAATSSCSTTGPNGLKTSKLAPYDLRLSDARVTDENAPVTFLAPDHPALNTPNKITRGRLRGLGAGARHLLPDAVGRALHADPRVQRPGRDAAEGRPAGGASTARATSSTPASCSSGNFPPACPGPTGCSPTWSRWANDPPRRRSSRPAAPPPRTSRRTRRPACRGSRTWPGVYLVVLGCFVTVGRAAGRARAGVFMNLLDFAGPGRQRWSASRPTASGGRAGGGT